VVEVLDLTDRRVVEEVLALQRVSYAVEARLIGTSEIPPLRDTPATLGDCGETFYVYRIEDELVGAISYRVSGEVLDIHRLVVHPDHFRKGIARLLVGHVARVVPGVQRTVVSTGSENGPARSLYRSLGFRETGEFEPSPGLRITTFERWATSRARDDGAGPADAELAQGPL
jgi:ribosomal protein S18 acetylase RimI-like enzyme